MITTLLVVASATLVVVAGMNYVGARSTLASIEGHLRSGINQKGTGLVTNQALALRDLVADNAFGDVARLVERTLEQDEQVSYGLFLSEDGQPWGFAVKRGRSGQADGKAEGKAAPGDWREFAPDHAAALPPGGVRTQPRQLRGETAYEFAMAVVDDKGAFLGSLRYGLSDAPLRQAVAEARSKSRRALATTVALLLLLGVATSVLGVLLSRQAAARITKPLGVLTAAVNAFARGDRDARVTITSQDEVQQLGVAFNNMATELVDYYTRLEQMNRTLEAKVDERTRALTSRNRDMRLVLDTIDQGLLTVSLSGRLAPERSAVVDRWFGAPAADEGFLDYIRRIDARYADTLDIGLEALRDNLLPWELCLAQLPMHLTYQGREYHCGYSLIQSAADQLDGLLVVIKDVTADLANARQEADAKERLAMFNAVAKDRAGLLAFVDEANERVARLPGASIEVQRRMLHTLKGNASLMGLGLFASICHRLEDEIAESAAPVTDVGLALLQRRWTQLTDDLRNLVGERPRDRVELSRHDLDLLAADVEAGLSAGEVRDRLAALALEPVDGHLARLGNYARSLALRLGKGELAVEIDGGGVRLDPRRWEGVFLDLVHVIRNAVDHGIETEAGRARAGKTTRPRLRLCTRLTDRTLMLEVEDDGAGIDWQAVRQAAARRGMPGDTEQQLVQALMADGLTTRAEVSDTSGRGVGLAAMRRQVESRGGVTAVKSERGQGTRFRFTFPFEALGAAAGVDAGTGAAGAGPVAAVAQAVY
jgi:two-component system, chemotaxis family, sensor kinase CheA